MQGQSRRTEMTAFERSEIFLMSEFYKLKQDMKHVNKTIIVYDLYEEDKLYQLSTLHAIGAGIISQDIEVTGVFEQDPDDSTVRIVYHDCNPKEIQKVQNTSIKYFKVHEQSKQEDLKNIRLYDSTVNGETVRIITLPIQKKLTNKTEVEGINKKIQAMEQEHFKESRKYQKKELEEFRQRCKIQIETEKQKYCESMRQKHQQIFNIETLLYITRQKTKLISVCGAISAPSNLSKEIESNQQALDNLFVIDNQGRQFIIHTATNAKKIPEFTAPKEISCVWSFKRDSKCPWAKNQCFNQKYFTQNKNGVRSKLYMLMSQGNNEYLAKVIEDFVKTWANITFSSSTCIAPVLKQAHDTLLFDQDLNQSFDLNSSSQAGSPNKSFTGSNKGKKESEIKQTFTVYTFNEIFKKYGVNSLKNLRTNQNRIIGQFYNTERLNGIQIEKGDQIIPDKIKLLTFIHFFYQINQQFCSRFTLQEKKNQKQFLQYVLNYLKSIYELVDTINKQKALNNKQVVCQDMQKYFNFLDFLFQSSTLIKFITNRDLAICNSLKVLFDNLTPKQNKLLTFILNNQEQIEPGQPVHYYDLYHKIIKENAKGFESKIQYIYVLLHLYKADQISTQYIYSKKRVVRAIKSYSEIIHQYDRVPEAKRDKLNKLEIEKKIARLLLVIGLPDEAAKIYQKNHLVKSAEKCFKQYLQDFTGDEKANKYIEFGKYLESEFSFPKAIDYYESAYEVAKSTAVRQESIKRKVECAIHMSKITEEQKRPFFRYYTGQGTECEFLNCIAIEQGAKVQQSQFTRLRNKLDWDEARGTSVINEGNQAEEEMFY